MDVNKDMTLLEQAISITEQSLILMEDVVELSKLLIKLVHIQDIYMILWTEEKTNYFRERAKLIEIQIKAWKPYNRAEAYANSVVEPKYWEYRIHMARWTAFGRECLQIDSFIKIRMFNNKMDAISMDTNIANRF